METYKLISDIDTKNSSYHKGVTVTNDPNDPLCFYIHPVWGIHFSSYSLTNKDMSIWTRVSESSLFSILVK